MKPHSIAALLILLAGAAAPLHAQAEARPIALPSDSKLVQFVYQPNNVYTVLTRPESVTNIQLSDDEELVTLAMGDTAQWVVSNSPGHIFIKPIFPDMVTSATLVTTQRTYQLTLRSSPVDGKFYQQVTWHNEALIIYRAEQAAARVAMANTARKFDEARLAATVTTPNVALEKLNFDYQIDGEGEFAPSQVFDDGKFTWVRLPDVQEMPAVFLVQDGEAALLNFTLRDSYMVIHRLVPEFLLKLGKQEVRVRRTGDGSSSRNRASKTFFGWGN